MENEKVKLGLEPAFAKSAFYHPDGGLDSPQEGMSKRLLIAKDAMCALLSNGTENIYEKDLTVMRAYQYADELLKQENQ